MSSNAPSCIPLPEGMTLTFKELSPYWLGGFDHNLDITDKKIKRCLESYYPFSSPNDMDQLRHVITKNLIVIFRALVFYGSFKDRYDYMAIVAEDLGYGRNTLFRIVVHYQTTRERYQITADHTYISPTASKMEKLLASLVDEYRFNGAIRRPFTPLCNEYVAAVRHAWKTKARHDVMSLLDEFPEIPPIPANADWLDERQHTTERSRSLSPERRQQLQDHGTPPSQTDFQRRFHRARSPLRLMTLELRPRVTMPQDHRQHQTQPQGAIPLRQMTLELRPRVSTADHCQKENTAPATAASQGNTAKINCAELMGELKRLTAMARTSVSQASTSPKENRTMTKGIKHLEAAIKALGQEEVMQESEVDVDDNDGSIC